MASLTTSAVRGRRAAGCAFLLVVLAGCTGTPDSAPTVAPSTDSPVPTTTTLPDRQPHTLVLNATGIGDAAISEIKYSVDGQLVQEGAVTLPWRKSLSIPADGLPHAWDLKVFYTNSRNAKIELFAIFNGQETARGRSAGGGSGNSKVSGSAGVGGSVQG